MNLTNITAINLNARKNGQRTVLIEMWAEKTSTGYQKTFTEDEVETKRSYLKSQVGEYVKHFTDFKIEYVFISSREEDLSAIEATVRNDGVEA